MNAFFLALMDPAILVISLSFLGFDDDVVSLYFPSLISLSNTLYVFL